MTINHLLLFHKLIAGKSTTYHLSLYILLFSLFQMVEWEANNLSLRVKGWWSNHWNKFDIIALLFFAAGNFWRLSHDPLVAAAAKDVLAFDLFLFYFRFLEYLTFIKQIGPKVIMIGKMV